MAVTIRLKRVGTRNTPVFRVVVTDRRSPRDGKFIEEIGTYVPRQATDNFKVDWARMEYWLSKGAQPSDTVRTLLKKAPKSAPTAAAA
jgi:small subunit ribosomal protein S16